MVDEKDGSTFAEFTIFWRLPIFKAVLHIVGLYNDRLDVYGLFNGMSTEPTAYNNIQIDTIFIILKLFGIISKSGLQNATRVGELALACLIGTVK
ncbi:hypothetical protein T265_01703 [Opisthorchis viverrini]|uniref:Uncharacterized protein n=1 Tax=Opisthorchis viverrini TaxID=6198 RepID=A0A074ZXW3_OPIVI|nr:hypothetical protein T265_01703 [Opisthorchis viverrini]KER32278.1 hypothetical protein T265_01703 [Opisthorchis viverrini]